MMSLMDCTTPSTICIQQTGQKRVLSISTVRTATYLVLDTRILSLSVLTNEHSVDIVIGSLETLDGDARSDVGEQVEGSAKSQVERDVPLADCDGTQHENGLSRKRTIQRTGGSQWT